MSQKLISERRERFTAACPRHPDPPQEAVYSKEIWVGTAGDMHPSLACQYECGCVITAVLDSETEPSFIR